MFGTPPAQGGDSMRAQRWVAAGLGLAVWGVSAGAAAETSMLHLGGLCSTDYLGGKGEAQLFTGWDGVNPVNLVIDQTEDHDAAVEALVEELDAYCRGEDDCYLIVHSNGGAVVAQAFSVFGSTEGHEWNINWVMHQGSNTGGSNLSDIAGSPWVRWLSRNLMCPMVGSITPDIHRHAFEYHDTAGVTFYMLAGDDTWWYSNLFLPDADDGAVGMDSSGGYVE